MIEQLEKDEKYLRARVIRDENKPLRQNEAVKVAQSEGSKQWRETFRILKLLGPFPWGWIAVYEFDDFPTSTTSTDYFNTIKTLGDIET